MVKHCCICKLQNGMIPDISFHNIPKDEELKKKWIQNIGREVSKTSTVCSQHFEITDVYYKVVGQSVKRFLRPTAIPCIKILSSCNSVNDMNSNDTLQIHDDMESVTVLSDVTNQNVTDKSDNAYLTSEANTENYRNDINICSSTSEMPSCTSTVNVVNKEEVDSQLNNTNIIEKISLKRRTISSECGSDQSPKRICNPRYIGDLSRQDFSSDVSWNIVQKYYEDSKRKQKSLNQKIKRLNERIETLKELLNHVKKLGLLSSEGCNVLEVSL